MELYEVGYYLQRTIGNELDFIRSVADAMMLVGLKDGGQELFKSADAIEDAYNSVKVAVANHITKESRRAHDETIAVVSSALAGIELAGG